MTQTAQVKRILPGGYAEVAVVRQGACAHDCAKCGGCMTAQQPTVTAQAENPVGAREGELVVVETENAKLLGVAAFVYLLPMVFLIVGYALGQAMHLSAGLSMLTGALAFGLSILLIWGLDRYVRRNKTLQYKIISVQER